MNYLDKIIEQKIEVSSHNELVSTLFSEFETIEKFRYAYVVYLNDCKKTLVLGRLGDDQVMINNEFNFKNELNWFMKCKNLRKTGGLRLFDFAAFISIYSNCYIRNRNIQEIYQKKIDYKMQERDTVVNEILADSHPFLLWHYQIENLLGLFYRDKGKIMEKCKGINRKQASYWAETKSLRIKSAGRSSLTLYDVLRECMVLGYTSTPPLKGSLALLKLINHKGGRDEDNN